MSPFAHFDFAPDKFPITIEALHPETRVVVWAKTIEKPADLAMIVVPPLRKQLGHPVVIRVRYGDGTVSENALPPPPPSDVFPSHCADCGVLLMGGATEHKQGCSFRALVEKYFWPEGSKRVQ